MLALIIVVGVLVALALADWRGQPERENTILQDSLGAPVVVMHYLDSLGLRTGEYKEMEGQGDGRYLALSPYVEFGNNTVSFYGYGHRHGIETLLISMNANDVPQRMDAVQLVVDAATLLHTRMFGVPLPEEAIAAIREPVDYTEDHDGRHFMVRVIRGGNVGTYTLRVLVSLERNPKL